MERKVVKSSNSNDKTQKIKVCLCKEEILDTIDMMLKITDPHEAIRPRMSVAFQATLKKIGGNALPQAVDAELNEHERALEKFMKEMRKLCKQSLPLEYKRLKDNNPGIVNVVLRYGRNLDFAMLNHMLDTYEKTLSGTKDEIGKRKVDYQIGKLLRNKFVLGRLGEKEENVSEIDPEQIDMEKIQKQHPQIFKPT